MEKRNGFTLIEILVVIGIISVLAGMSYPVILMVIAKMKRSVTVARMTVISQALANYSSDFSGSYPPDCIDSEPKNIRTGKRLENSSQLLCYFLESSFIDDDGSFVKYYQTFAPKEKKKMGAGTIHSDVDLGRGLKGTVSEDYLIDAFGGPILYDERLSENTRDGLNSQSFVLISGGRRDKNPAVTAETFEEGKGTWSGIFTSQELSTIDTHRDDYRKTIPPESSKTNDDILNR